MSHKLYDITLYYYYGNDLDTKRKFTGLQNVVSQLYVHHLNGYKPKGTTRISATLSDVNDHFFYAGSVLTVQRKFDKDLYWTLSLQEQKKMILDTVHGTAVACAEKYDWDKSVFEKAYEAVLEKNFEFKIESEKKNSRDRNHKASTVKEVLNDKTIIYVRFYDKQDQLIEEVELFSSPSHEMFYGGILKKCKWLNNTDFGFEGKFFSLYVSMSDFTVKTALGVDTFGNRLKSSLLELGIHYLTFKGKDELLNQNK